MAAMFETNLVAKRLAIPDEVFMVEKDKTPVFSALRKQNVEANLLGQVVLEKFPAAASTGVLDGTPVTTVDYVARSTADVCGQHFRKAWGVTNLADLTATYGVKNQKGHQRAWAMMIVRRMLEVQVCSNTDGASESGETPWTTRGILQWLNPSAQASRPVPATFRPAAATRYTGSMKTGTGYFVEAALKALLSAAYDETHSPVDLDVYVGSTAKGLISDMAQADPYRYDGTDKLQNKVVLIDFDFGTCRVHLAPFIGWDTATGLATDYSPRSGFGINLDQWAWEYLKGKAPANTDLAEDGSGPRGFVDCVGRLWSKNPQGQVSILTDSSA